MNNRLKIIMIFFLFYAFSSFQVRAQEIKNLNVQLGDDKATINYDLAGVQEGQEVEVRVYATIKGYAMRLYRASGDVGKGITGGNNKVIIWNNDEELTSYKKEDITFKLDVISKNQNLKVEKEKTKNKGIFASISSLFVEQKE